MICIAGLGLVTPLGSNPKEILKALLLEKNGFQEITTYNTDSFSSKKGGLIANLPVPKEVPRSKLRRLSTLSKFFLSAALEALADCGSLIPWTAEEKGLTFATSHGSLITCEEYHKLLLNSPEFASPMLFSEGGLNSSLAHISIHTNFKGSLLSFSGDEESGANAILTASDILEMGKQKLILAGGGHEWSQLGHQIYDRISQGSLILGEGAVVLALESEESAQIREHLPYAYLQDGARFHFESIQQEKIFSSISKFLKKNQCGFGDIEAVITPKNNTIKDQVYSQYLEDSFPQAKFWHPNLAIGESFACSSAFQIALGALLIREKKLSKVLIFCYGVRGNGCIVLLTDKNSG